MDGQEKPIFEINFKGENSVSLPLNLLQTSVFPVVLISGDRMRSVGTCFAISNHGLCMTAKHVIDEVPFIGDPSSGRHRLVDGNLGILYISPAPVDDGVSDLLGGFMPMTTANTISGVDIAVMHLNLPVDGETGESIPFPAQRLRLDFPVEGDRLMALGYEKGEWSFDDRGVHTLSHTFTASTGFSGPVHPTGRDKVLMTTPCFQTSAPFRSGMSGGPVIAADGMVVGVVSTGFELAEGETPISYATPLAPSMGISLQARTAEREEVAAHFLWDFAEGGAITVDQGNANVVRTGQELIVNIEGGEYRSLLGA